MSYGPPTRHFSSPQRQRMSYSLNPNKDEDLSDKIIHAIKSLRENNAEIITEIEENQNEIGQLKKEIRTLKSENRELKSKADTQKTQIDTLKSDVDTLKDKLDMVCAWMELTEKKL